MFEENRATDEMVEAARKTCRALGEAAGDIQEQAIRLWASPFENWTRLYRSQVEGSRAVMGAMMEQTRRQQEAFRASIRDGRRRTRTSFSHR